MSRSERFWNFMAKRYAKQPIRDPDSYRRTLDKTKAHLTESDRVLEVGCGTGSTALILAPHVREYVGIDSSRRMVEIAGDKLGSEDPGNLQFTHAEITDPTLANISYDKVLAYNVLHLLPDLNKGVQTLHDALAPGGILVSKTICVASGAHFWRGLLGLLAPLGLLPYVRFMSSQTLEAALQNAGFEILESYDLPKGGKARFIVARRSQA